MNAKDLFILFAWGCLALFLIMKLINKNMKLDKRGLEALSQLHDVEVLRKRYNRGVGRFFSRLIDTRDIPPDAPSPVSTPWTCLEDHLYFQGRDSKGRVKTFYVMPFSKDNLNQMREFLTKSKDLNSDKEPC